MAGARAEQGRRVGSGADSPKRLSGGCWWVLRPPGLRTGTWRQGTHGLPRGIQKHCKEVYDLRKAICTSVCIVMSNSGPISSYPIVFASEYRLGERTRSSPPTPMEGAICTPCICTPLERMVVRLGVGDAGCQFLNRLRIVSCPPFHQCHWQVLTEPHQG